MSNVQVLIDSNVYLDLYTSKDLRELLTTLPTIEGLFVSAQIVDEVMRRRVGVTIDALKPAIDATKAALPIPEAALQEFTEDVTRDIEKFTEAAKALRSKLVTSVEETLRRVAEGTDSVSVALGKVFQAAATPSNAELSRARARRERGTPPGKPENPLGDQVTWEQFLSRCRGAEHVFIVSRDGDFLDRWNGEFFLNPVLREDLRKVAPNSELHVFNNLAAAIPALSKAIGGTVAVPAPEALEKAKNAEEQVAAREILKIDQTARTFEKFATAAAVLRSLERGTALDSFTNLSKTLESWNAAGSVHDSFTILSKTLEGWKATGSAHESLTNLSKTLEGWNAAGTAHNSFTILSKTLEGWKATGNAHDSLTNLSKTLESWKAPGTLLDNKKSVDTGVDARKDVETRLDAASSDTVATDSPAAEGTPTLGTREDKDE